MLSYVAGKERNWHSHFERQRGKNINTQIYSLDPNFLHLIVYPIDIHTRVHQDVYTKHLE